jgi:two-component sensor histidine kinase
VSAHGGPDRFVVTGAPLWLPPALSLSLSLVLHELATNAAKYGALSAEGGTVAIDWKITGRADALRLTLRWTERGGPPVMPPARHGFGSRLIQASFASAAGTTNVDYAAEGLVCIIDVAVTTPKPAIAPV